MVKSITLLKRNIGILFLLLLTSISNIKCTFSTDKSLSKPNVLLIYTDDHAQWAVGAYGNEEVHTPNIDRLAAEGMCLLKVLPNQYALPHVPCC